jgi:hypothetical protein
VVSFATDEAWDALLGVKTAEAGTAAAAGGGGALSFLLCSIKMTVGGHFYSNEEQFPFLLLICNQML